VSLEVAQVPAAIDRVRDIAASNGGYLSSSNVYTQQNDRKTGTAMIRIPAEKYDAVMGALAPLGKVLSTSEQRSDVTEQYVDLTIQNQSYHNQLENYYRLMAKATAVEDIIKIQGQIDQITLNLNRIEGQLRYLSSQIDLSTITVNLQEPEPVGGETGYNIVTSINEGIAAFFGMISAIIVFLFAVLPLIIIALVAYAIYRWYKKRKGGSATLAAPVPAETKS
jgi:ABC-type glycerol-3-phosphate transport system permease component